MQDNTPSSSLDDDREQEGCFECRAIEPLLERIGCLFDLPALRQVADQFSLFDSHTPEGQFGHQLQDLVKNSQMQSELTRYAIDYQPDVETLIQRHKTFGDTLALCESITARITQAGSPVEHIGIKKRRLIDDALVANLALYGLYTLVSKDAEKQLLLVDKPTTATDDE